eukprot:GHRR01013797.1.p1 GENE.GHRR01013797.1~~GHRR01013797.1.p1  ORF type:complete len:1007 (+),score=453.07 GHRR01013797.1:167-3187(+)
MSGSIRFKFKNSVGQPEVVTFGGFHISGLELKNLIAEKKGLVDVSLELTDAASKAVYDDAQIIPRGSAVIVRRLNASKAPTRAQQAAAASANADELPAGPAMAALQAISGVSTNVAAAGQADEAQLKAGQDREDLQIKALVSAQQESWQAQTDRNILATRAREQQLAQRGRGRGFGQYSTRGRSMSGPPKGFCKFCGKLDDHFSEDCPQKNNPRTDLRHVRAPAGIPSELLEASDEGGLLLNSGKIGALKGSTAQAAKEFAALPTAARRTPNLPALPAAPNDPADELKTLLLENGDDTQQAQQHGQQQLQSVQQAMRSPQQGHQLVQQQQSTQPGRNGSLPASSAAPAAAAAAAAADAAMFDDDDFGFSTVPSTGAPALFDDEDLAPAAAGAAAAAGGLNLSMGMELPAQQASAGPSKNTVLHDNQQQQQPSRVQQPLQKLQQQTQWASPRSPLPQHMQPPAPQHQQRSPLAQPRSPLVLQQQQQPPAVQAAAPGDLQEELKVKLDYTFDIIKSSGHRHWQVKDLRAAFFGDRPLTVEEFEAIKARYAPAKPPAPKQLHQHHSQEIGRQRSRDGSRHYTQSRSRSPVWDGPGGHRRPRQGEERSSCSRARRSRSTSRHRSRSRDRSPGKDRSKTKFSKRRGDKADSKADASVADIDGVARSRHHHESRRSKRRSRSHSPHASVKQEPGGAAAVDGKARGHALLVVNNSMATASQDLAKLLADTEVEDNKQALRIKAAAAANNAISASPNVAAAAPSDAVSGPAVPPAAAVPLAPSAAAQPARRPIAERLGLQHRSPSPEPHQYQQDDEEHQQAASGLQSREHSPRHSSQDRNHNRSRSYIRSRSQSHSSNGSQSQGVGKDQPRQPHNGSSEEQQHTSADEDFDERLSFGTEEDQATDAADQVYEAATAAENGDHPLAADGDAAGSGSDREVSGGVERQSTRHRHRSNSRRRKKSKKEKKSKRRKRRRRHSGSRDSPGGFNGTEGCGCLLHGVQAAQLLWCIEVCRR